MKYENERLMIKELKLRGFKISSWEPGFCAMIQIKDGQIKACAKVYEDGTVEEYTTTPFNKKQLASKIRLVIDKYLDQLDADIEVDHLLTYFDNAELELNKFIDWLNGHEILTKPDDDYKPEYVKWQELNK